MQKLKIAKYALQKMACVMVEMDTGDKQWVTLFGKEMEALLKDTTGTDVSEKLLSIDRVQIYIKRNNDVAYSAEVL